VSARTVDPAEVLEDEFVAAVDGVVVGHTPTLGQRCAASPDATMVP